MATRVYRRFMSASGGGLQPEARGPTGALVFFFAIRWIGWLVALLAVLFGKLDPENTRHEPLLLILSFAYIALGTLYVPFLHGFLRRTAPFSWLGRIDLRSFGVVDVLVSFGLIYFSGGFNTPYFHYANASLLVPTFLFGWRSSALLLVGYVGGYFAIIATAGHGTDGPWTREEANKLPGIVLTSVMVVLVAQFFSWLVRRIEEQREQARRAFREASILYEIAHSVSESDSDEDMVSSSFEALEGSMRFGRLAIYQLQEAQLELKAAREGEAAPPRIALSGDSLVALSKAPDRLADPSAGLGWLAPVRLQDRLWGAVAFSTLPGNEQAGARLAGALASQLSLGLTKLALGRQREELAAIEERSRISREIHDGIAQSIYMLSLNLEKAADLAQTSDAGASLRSLVGIAKTALLEVRQYIFDLKPLLAGEASLVDALRSQAREFGAVSGVPLEFTVRGTEPTLLVETASSLYRIAQESLANAFRHANARRVDMEIAFEYDSVSLSVADDGQGFAEGSQNGHGLRNMRRRAESLGGSFEVKTNRESGTRVLVKLPLERKA